MKELQKELELIDKEINKLIVCNTKNCVAFRDLNERANLVKSKILDIQLSIN